MGEWGELGEGPKVTAVNIHLFISCAERPSRKNTQKNDMKSSKLWYLNVLYIYYI